MRTFVNVAQADGRKFVDAILPLLLNEVEKVCKETPEKHPLRQLTAFWLACLYCRSLQGLDNLKLPPLQELLLRFAPHGAFEQEYLHEILMIGEHGMREYPASMPTRFLVMP